MFRRTFLALATAATLAAPAFAGSHSMDIVDTASAAGGFETLLAAATAAGLVDTLKSEGPFTVFAPTDAAFAALPDGAVATLLKPENKDKLVEALTYHVIPGKVTAAHVKDGMTAATVQGGKVKFTVHDGVMINDANVVPTDIMASNGVIHVIDKVLVDIR